MAKPEKTFKVGPVRASVFRNPIQQNGRNILLPKVVIEVRYKDKSGEWKGTNSLSLNDLPKAVIALQSAYSYLLENKGPSSETDPDLDPEPARRVFDFQYVSSFTSPRTYSNAS